MNVVYLILDSLNPRLMSRYGHHHKTTPFLDSVIDRFGTVYSNCFTNASFSPIAHRGMMNGMFNVTKMGNNCFRQLESPTVAEIFKQGGHETARFVGLGHMGSQFGFGKGFDTFDEPQVGKDHPNIWCATRWDSYGDIDGKTYSFRMGNYWVQNYLKWMFQHKDRDFFVWGHYSQIHIGAQRVLPRQYRNMFGGDYSQYRQKIRWCDDNLIKRTINLLQKLKILDKTVIVITADHGEAFYKHNETYHGISVYDEPMRVPLIVLDPRQSGCKYEERLCRTVDIVPTMLDLAGFKVRGQVTGMDGVSLVDFPKDPLFAYMQNYGTRYSGEVRRVRSQRYKLIKKYDDINIRKFATYAPQIPRVCKKPIEFYDLLMDPEQLDDLRQGPLATGRYDRFQDLNSRLDRMVKNGHM